VLCYNSDETWNGDETFVILIFEILCVNTIYRETIPSSNITLILPFSQRKGERFWRREGVLWGIIEKGEPGKHYGTLPESLKKR
jgi:hypothetical protein